MEFSFTSEGRFEGWKARCAAWDARGVMHRLRHAVHEAFKSSVENLTPARTSSAYESQGVLSPDEFVLAGDALVRACPTWSWARGSDEKAKKFLPREKQYLVTRRVPCAKRAKDMEAYAGSEIALGGEDEGWVKAGEGRVVDGGGGDGEIPDIGTLTLDDASKKTTNDETMKIDDIPEIGEDFEDEDDDAVVLPSATEIARAAGRVNGGTEDDDIVKTRTYDLTITYDKYYQTPRVWLNGYDENSLVLKPSKTLEDVSAEHAQKTVTIDPHPHTGVPSASIHPCKHSSVMKKLVESMRAERGESPSVETYMFVFLKFIASVIPTVEYDYTL